MNGEPALRRWPRPLTCALLVAYACVLPLPHLWPAMTGSPLFLVYVLSLPVALFAFAIVGLIGAIGLRRAPDPARHARARRRVSAAALGIASVLLAVMVSRALPQPLPSGSDLRAFDSAAWRAPDAAEFVENDVTPRQKMLGDVVARVLPGSDRAAIVQALGPGETSDHFADGGPELLYRLGPQRDVPLGLDSEWLLIQLDADGRYVRHAIAND